MKSKEIHIASCVAYVLPADLEATRRAIEAAGLADVPRFDPLGKLVLLFERDTSAEVVAAMDAVRALPGVMAVHLAYQHAEPESELQENQP